MTALVLAILPFTSRWLTRIYGHRTAAIRTKWIILVLFSLGALAPLVRERSRASGLYRRYGLSRVFQWRHFLDSPPPDPDRRVSHPLLFSPRRNFRFSAGPRFRPVVFLLLLGGKVLSKIFGLYPVIGRSAAIETNAGIIPC